MSINDNPYFSKFSLIAFFVNPQSINIFVLSDFNRVQLPLDPLEKTTNFIIKNL